MGHYQEFTLNLQLVLLCKQSELSLNTSVWVSVSMSTADFAAGEGDHLGCHLIVSCCKEHAMIYRSQI